MTNLTELRMYSTAAGKIPQLVGQGKAECFVEYAQYIELLEAYEELKSSTKDVEKLK